jgi:anthranilate phosphoribosyltransferase
VDVETRRPEDYGFARCRSAELAGGDAPHNAEALRAVLEGRDQGPHRDCLLLGAALALEVVGKARSPRDGVELAAQAIDTGAARRVLDVLARVRPSVAGVAT